MKKRYDYHSSTIVYVSIFVILLFLLLLIIFFRHISKNSSFTDLLPVFLMDGLGLAVCSFGYLAAKKTFIEISDKGILFSGVIKKIYAPWITVREIKLLGRIDKIYTDRGNFYIKEVESAENPKMPLSALIKINRYKFKEELLGEIKRRSSSAKVTQSIFLRPL